MDDISVYIMKTHCCACLSVDRRLTQLCRIVGGINSLYSLLSFDSEAYREGFYMDSANLFICWECRSLLHRFCQFRTQVCAAQRTLTALTQREETKTIHSLSRLSKETKSTYNDSYIVDELVTNDPELIEDNFIDCGLVDVKSEPEDYDDIPLSQLNTKDEIKAKKILSFHETQNGGKEGIRKRTKAKKKVKIKETCSKEASPDCKEYCKTIKLTEEEMQECRKKMRLAKSYVDAIYTCEMCIEGFEEEKDFTKHKTDFHTKKAGHAVCDICHHHTQTSLLEAHRDSHYSALSCNLCSFQSHSGDEMLVHLKTAHGVAMSTVHREARARLPDGAGPKPRRSAAMTDAPTELGYLCSECDMYFENKNKRWKHIQRAHREGFACASCGKRFAFRSNLLRHEIGHVAPRPRAPCPVCAKMIRTDLMKTHSLIHTQRQAFSCEECQKTFASAASYDHHLKYTAAHTTKDLLKYKCSACNKGYRSRGELRDHYNYQHKAETLHKCPVCEKALATRRCITRHVRRAHQGRRESERDKICQQCGRAFRDKKGLREHESIHTGERALSCSVCGAAFRQSASLYAHRRRLHGAVPTRIVARVIDQ